MSQQDVPKQYKYLIDKSVIALANAGDAIFPILGELGGNKLECYGDLVKIVVVAKVAEEKNSQSASPTNSDYTAALFETIEKMCPSFIDNNGDTVVSLKKDRLNAALKAVRHCA